MSVSGPGRLVRIHIGENDRFGHRKLHEEIVTRCRQADMELVTVYRGAEGFGASSRVHRPGFLGRSRDAPIVITVADTAEKIEELVPLLNEVVDEGLIAISEVEILRYPTFAQKDPK